MEAMQEELQKLKLQQQERQEAGRRPLTALLGA